MKEIWKDIKNFEGLYQVSNLGRIKNNKDEILKPAIKRGYNQVTLCKNGERKYIGVHRLVAESFIPNPNNLPQVNHKDENKLNNTVQNLEFCDCSYNINYGTRNKKISKKLCKLIEQYDLDNNFIKLWYGAKEIKRKLKIDNSLIGKCCKGKRKTAGGFVWKYKEGLK